MTKTPILLLVGRDDWQRDEALNQALLTRLRENNVDIRWEDPAAGFIFSFRKWVKRLRLLPKRLERLHLRAAQVLYGILHPSYFSYLYHRKDNAVLSRCDFLKKTISSQGIAERVIVLARSSGGRVSSLIADELGFKKIICLGYPFKHPDSQDEPERYQHLANLQTPMLIIQGVHDEYGGLGIEDHYPLSENIQISYFDTNHNFTIDDATITRLVDAIEKYSGLVKRS
ncbi:alpha/beta family hydrolase [Aeromonas media]|uniref:alpha/beta family hydrolase n=1 Tax=Aeromonas media TaxID=651 RepID=UPI0038D029B5